MVDVLAVIPARGGSKGIPRKNILNLAGYPLIAYSIAAGLNSALVTRVIVSTDDEEIAQKAKDFGADVPFIRPDELAQDDSRDLPVFQHALNWLKENESYEPEIVVQLRPTSPFRSPELIDDAVRILIENPGVDSVRGVVHSGQNPYKMWRFGPDGGMEPLLDSDFPEAYNMPRQELPPTYWQTGHIDAIRTKVILDGSMSGEVIYPCLIDSQFSVDLDNTQDWQGAEEKISSLQTEIVVPGMLSTAIREETKLLVLDFDGVLTDNRVYVNQHGEETIAAHRGDGMGISLVKQAGIEVIIITKERNPVVKARADKLQVPVYQGIDEKGSKLKEILKEKKLEGREVVYIGNDINDLPVVDLVGLVVAVQDAHPSFLEKADLVLKSKGGFGAVREFCDLLLEKLGKK